MGQAAPALWKGRTTFEGPFYLHGFQPVLANRAQTPYNSAMNLILPAEQQKWLEAQVAAGRFASVEAAAQAAIAAAIADEIVNDTGDLSWAKPYADQGREDAALGRVLTLEEHRARMAARLEALRR